MSIFALLKSKHDGEPSTFHGITSIGSAAEAWQDGSEANWYEEFSEDDEGEVFLSSQEPYLREKMEE